MLPCQEHWLTNYVDHTHQRKDQEPDVERTYTCRCYRERLRDQSVRFDVLYAKTWADTIEDFNKPEKVLEIRDTICTGCKSCRCELPFDLDCNAICIDPIDGRDPYPLHVSIMTGELTNVKEG